MNNPAHTTVSNRDAVVRALTALGEAWRGDWMDFDGRTLRSQLQSVTDFLDDVAPPITYEALCVSLGICPENQCWPQWCGDEADWSSCEHLVAAAGAGE